jgi:hypothetical protein
VNLWEKKKKEKEAMQPVRSQQKLILNLAYKGSIAYPERAKTFRLWRKEHLSNICSNP